MENLDNCIYIPDDYFLDPNLFVVPKKYEGYLETILIPRGTIRDRTKLLAKKIIAEGQNEPLTFICVLRGAFKFYESLLHFANRASSTSEIHHSIEFIRAISYTNDQQNDLIIEGLDNIQIEGRSIVIVEDMVDRGKTLAGVSDVIRSKNPKSLKICVMSYKRNPINTFIVPDYIGFSLPNKWIVGYNIDYNGHFRDLPHVAIINDSAKEKFRV